MQSPASANNLQVTLSNKQIMQIALPITLSVLIPQLNLLVNNIFLGRLSAEALGNAAITGIYFLIFAVAGNGLNAAVQTVLSKYAGAGQSEKFSDIITQSIRICLQFSLTCIAFTYTLAPILLKQIADPVSFPEEMGYIKIIILSLPFLYLFQMGNAFLVASLNGRFLLYAFVGQAVLNVLFDYLLIFGHFGFPAMGFHGAAVASLIAEIFACLFVYIVIVKKGLKKKYNLFTSWRQNKAIGGEIRAMSVPLIVQYMVSVTTWLIFFLLIETKGTMAKALSNTMRNVYGIAGVFVWAFAGTCNTMVGNFMGQKRQDLVLPTIYRITMWSTGLCVVLLIPLNIFPETFFRIFSKDVIFVQEAIPVVRIVSLGVIFLSVANVWLNGVTGTGRTKVNLAIELIAITLYLAYTYHVMVADYTTLSRAWTNEFVYWNSIFLMAWGYMRWGGWRKTIV